jgi:hypothetical protein
MDIGTPEWPRSALAGTVGVHCTPDCCVKEDAVLVLFLDETDCLPADDAREAFPKLCLREIETLSQRCSFLGADEHGAGKSTAATPAPQARKAQAVFIPESVYHEIMHLAALVGNEPYTDAGRTANTFRGLRAAASNTRKSSSK